jgi:hypothetical protein
MIDADNAYEAALERAEQAILDVQAAVPYQGNDFQQLEGSTITQPKWELEVWQDTFRRLRATRAGMYETEARARQ